MTCSRKADPYALERLDTPVASNLPEGAKLAGYGNSEHHVRVQSLEPRS